MQYDVCQPGKEPKDKALVFAIFGAGIFYTLIHQVAKRDILECSCFKTQPT